MRAAGERRIAMWSGPRNISTAMMRAWGNRPDTVVCDEPLYAHYLLHTRLPHPGADEIIRRHDTDWRRVVSWLIGPIPEGKRIFYQKHMAHHLLPHIERGWLRHLTHCFLIRHPREMLASLHRFLPEPTLLDTGLPQQVELFDRECERLGRVPPVLDAADVLRDPPRLLRLLCEAVDVPFTPAMLSWPPGRRPTDGVWAKYWYASVERSTGWEPYVPRPIELPPALLPLYEECLPYYERLSRHRLGAPSPREVRP